MKLTYQTSIATFIQFTVLSLLTLVSQLVSVVSTCHQNDGNCISNFITSTIFYILVAVVFGSIWLIGYIAQNRRSKWLAQLLICIEGLVCLVALFSLKLSLHSHKNIFGLLVSFGVFVIAAWIITLAFRLMRSGGGRVVSKQRARRRRPNSTS